MSLSANRPQNAHIAELDGVRGVAIGLVLLYHYLYGTIVTHSGTLARYAILPLRVGWSGVDLFFVLSGFLIGGILLDARGSSNYFRTFYIRRFFRIVPLYAFVFALAYVLARLLARGFAPQFHWMLDHQLPWVTYIFYVQNIWMAIRETLGIPGLAMTWSLAIEEQFYLTLPTLIWLVEPRRLQKFLLVLIVATPLLRTVFHLLWPAQVLLPYVLMPSRADSLLLGVLAATLLRNPVQRAWFETHPRLVLGALLLLFCGCLADIHQFNGGSPLMQTVGFTWVALMYALLLLHALTQPLSPIARALRWSWLRGLGKIAYGLYLLHYFVFMFLTAVLSPNHAHIADWPVLDSWRQFGVTILAFVSTIALCNLSWRYFEKPLVQIGHRWQYSRHS
jgi:peptidoglycan/LPS O-acetylase OafA/YrhL